jgi:hypothetical protein
MMCPIVDLDAARCRAPEQAAVNPAQGDSSTVQGKFCCSVHVRHFDVCILPGHVMQSGRAAGETLQRMVPPELAVGLERERTAAHAGDARERSQLRHASDQPTV